MPRYLIERDLPAGTSETDVDDAVRRSIAATATLPGVRWIHSNLALDRSKFFCEYEAPDEETVRQQARLAEIPADRVTPVREVLARDYTDSRI